ncbi:MAG: uroporphyrinogen-III synthase [Geminicoccaceae bacterium]
MLVLVTRPLGQAARTARLLEARGHDVLIDPVLEVRLLPVPLLGADIVAVAVTSANAVPALAAIDPGLPVFAVGEATAAAARAVGSSREIRVAEGSGIALAQLIGRSATPGRGTILHLAGTDVRPGFEKELVESGYGYRRAIVYETMPTADMDPAAAAAIRDHRLDAVLLYSPRSAALWAAKVSRLGLGPHLHGTIAACLSNAVAAPLRGLVLREVRVARAADQKSLLGCLDAPE